MSGYTPEQIDWMQHGTQLLVAIVDRPAHRTVVEVNLLKREIELRLEVMRRIAANEVRDDVQITMEQYMRAVADLEIARYGRQIDESTFFAGCYAARTELREHTATLNRRREYR